MIGWLSQNEVLIDSTLSIFLLAVSIQIPLRLGVISFASIGYYAIGGYGTAILMTQHDVASWTAVAASTVVATAVAWLLGLVIARLAGLYLAMATVSFSLLISAVALNGGSITGGAVGLYGVLGDITTWQVAIVAIVVAVIVSFTERGRLSRRFDAIREDPQLASAMGIAVARYRRLSFPVSGLLGGLAGALAVNLKTTISPESVSFSLVVLALTVIIVGGQASWVGALIGSVFFVWLPEVLQSVGDWEAVIYGVVVVTAAVLIPGGVVGVVNDWRHRREWAREREGIERLEAASEGPVVEHAASGAGEDG
ncbi:MAG: branched-chain amino acid ABC transporter permease [Frankiales bacterium]|nr:branched-chain amino acid ABC transporter permease [Frankiales bacterium]